MMFSVRDLKRLILPLVVEQILLVTVGMADTMMVSSVGQEAISAISLVDSINLLLINVFSALGTGGAIVTAQYLGREDDENASLAAKQLIYVVGAVATVVMAVCLLGNGPILRAIFGKVEPAVMEGSRLYFYITALSYPFIGIYNGGAAVFRAMGNSKVSMLCSALMNLINIGGNAVLIYGLGAGVEGAAIATLLSRMAAALVILWLLCKGGGRVQLHQPLKPEYHREMVRGMVTVVGQCVGAGEYEQARKYMLGLTGLVYVSMGTLEVFLGLSAGFWVGLFQLPPETAAIAVQLIHSFVIFAIIFWPASFALPNGLRAAGDVRFTMVVSTVSMWVFRIGASFLLCSPLVGMGIMGVWVAMYIDWIARCAAFLWRFFSGRWKGRQVI